MKYQDYFSMFLNIEAELLKFIKVIDYTDKHKNIYAHNLVLLLLQTCPVIESYLVRIATTSNTVKQSVHWNSTLNFKIWDSNKQVIKEKDGKRQIGNFPKFACLNNELFDLSSKKTKFYHSDQFQIGSDTVSIYQPFKPLDKAARFDSGAYESKNYPAGYETPKWWTAYNKIKHSFDDVAQEQVNYSVVIEAISALFTVLVYCEPDLEVLKSNGFANEIGVKSNLFEGVL